MMLIKHFKSSQQMCEYKKIPADRIKYTLVLPLSAGIIKQKAYLSVEAATGILASFHAMIPPSMSIALRPAFSILDAAMLLLRPLRQ